MFRPLPVAASATIRNTLALIFWAADASFSPDSRQAHVISSQPSREDSWLMVQLGKRTGAIREEDQKDGFVPQLCMSGAPRNMKGNQTCAIIISYAVFCLRD